MPAIGGIFAVIVTYYDGTRALKEKEAGTVDTLLFIEPKFDCH